MTYPIPSIADAIAYAVKTEAAIYGNSPRVTSSSVDYENEFVIVETADNTWSVWIEGGNLYGEH